MTSPLRVCFHVPYLYPALVPGSVEFAGGAEIQMAGVARGLAARGFEVSAVACRLGQPQRSVVDGVTVIASFDPKAGWPVLRFFHPRLSGTWAALREARADVYYVNGSGFPAGIAADAARSFGARFVLHLASDYDVMKSLPVQTNPRDRWWQRRALGRADVIVAQTEVQRRMVRENFGRESVIVPNWVEIPPAPADPGQDGAIVWLGTYKEIKRPEWFLELARRLPRQRLIMAGVIPPPPDTRAWWDAAQAAARERPNLEVRGFVPHHELGALFARAALFVHTSPVEGFPNTVLEAWAHGLPTLTAVDPDGLVTQERVGAVAGTLDELVTRAEELMANPDERRASGARARRLAETRHALPAVLDRIEALVRMVAERPPAR